MTLKPESEPNPPPGVVAVYTDPEGRVIASVSDFKPDYPASYTLYQAQRARAERKLNYAVLKAYCSPVVVAAVEDYYAEHIVRNLKGKRVFIPIGHPADSEQG